MEFKRASEVSVLGCGLTAVTRGSASFLAGRCLFDDGRAGGALSRRGSRAMAGFFGMCINA
jgi:hypothetical protein